MNLKCKFSRVQGNAIKLSIHEALRLRSVPQSRSLSGVKTNMKPKRTWSRNEHIERIYPNGKYILYNY